MNVVFLRVGIDSGCGGMAGPLFDKNEFEFLPIDSEHRHAHGRTYGNVVGRHGRKLIEYFPERRQAKMRACFIHDDPEFNGFTYGDPTRPKQGLRELTAGDLLVFYAGLCGWGSCAQPTALYIVAYLEVERAGLYPDLVAMSSKRKVEAIFAENWHVAHGDINGKVYKRRRADGTIQRSKTALVLVKGGKGSKLLKTAVQLSAPKKKLDRGGHPVFVLDPAHKKHFGSFTKLNAIQRSTPRWVEPEFVEAAAKFVRALS